MLDHNIPEGMTNPGNVYTISQGKSGMIGVYRLETQMLPGNGKFERTGLGSDRDAKEATNTAFNFSDDLEKKVPGLRWLPRQTQGEVRPVLWLHQFPPMPAYRADVEPKQRGLNNSGNVEYWYPELQTAVKRIVYE